MISPIVKWSLSPESSAPAHFPYSKRQHEFVRCFRCIQAIATHSNQVLCNAFSNVYPTFNATRDLVLRLHGLQKRAELGILSSTFQKVGKLWRTTEAVKQMKGVSSQHLSHHRDEAIYHAKTYFMTPSTWLRAIIVRRPLLIHSLARSNSVPVFWLVFLLTVFSKGSTKLSTATTR